MDRRRFTQGAVLATLANRPAWGQTISPECISAAGFASINTGMSLNPSEEDFLQQANLRGVTEVDGDVCLNPMAKEASINEPIRYNSKLRRQRDWLGGGPLQD